MIVDGKKIVHQILNSVKEEILISGSSPRLAVITCAPNFETQKFLGIKMRKAAEVGIDVSVVELPNDVTQEDAVATIQKSVAFSDGIVVQLPFPRHIDRDVLIDAIPKTHDVDAFNLKDSEILPPVIGAMCEILTSEQVDLKEKQVVVVGNGRLVGQPAADWFKTQGASVTVVAKGEADLGGATIRADILVLGAGAPGLIKPDMVKKGVIILDAGTSEEGGELRGDADPLCAEKAILFTPVPGGIGPITVAVLLRNVVLLRGKKG